MRIPSIMYHSVGTPDPGWIWSHLTIPVRRFESQMRWLSRNGYHTLTCEEYLHCMKEGASPGKAVLLTFDDGYLDNWTHAAPVLERYGFCGTIFVNPEFADPSEGCRPRMGEPGFDPARCMGFLNWDEMRAMERSGVMEIQSHAMTHTWYFSGPSVVDFHHPGDAYPWMDWNSRPDLKWASLGPEAHRGGWGAPVFEHAKSLAAPRYFPPEGVRERLETFCAQQDESFFTSSYWRSTLSAVYEDAARDAGPGRMETEQEYLERVRWELRESKAIIEEKLGKRVDVLCWPGGGNSAEAMKISAEYYAATTLPSSQRHLAGFDEYGCYRMARIGAPSVETSRGVVYPGGLYAGLVLREYGGDMLARTLRRAGKAMVLLTSYLFPQTQS
ncbi:polysaccharide deacetylase family protein [Salidesulfovibrio brasiliensis]|uniref:polysaccharide deacetylase family protein n=1 Tax=Salidesulfovibrio brasiliensis TaxID=221711 RepID=UPI0006D1A7EA|nr:polysaccharide deacetylase family protein [Salidesulfovibrio brasiliensis]